MGKRYTFCLRAQVNDKGCATYAPVLAFMSSREASMMSAHMQARIGPTAAEAAALSAEELDCRAEVLRRELRDIEVRAALSHYYANCYSKEGK